MSRSSFSAVIATLGIDLGKNSFHLVGQDERGITVRQGLAPLRQALPGILGSSADALSPRLVRLIADLIEDWRQLDERIAAVSAEIEALAAQDDHCQRLMSVPGVGPIISSAVVAAIGTGAGFKQGRDFGAWLGLVHKQESTGDRTILGKISKRVPNSTAALPDHSHVRSVSPSGSID